jgi:hypothetical protein
MSYDKELPKHTPPFRCGGSTLAKNLENLSISSTNESQKAKVRFISDYSGSDINPLHDVSSTQTLLDRDRLNIFVRNGSAMENTQSERKLLDTDNQDDNYCGEVVDDGDSNRTSSLLRNGTTSSSSDMDNSINVENSVEHLGIRQRTRGGNAESKKERVGGRGGGETCLNEENIEDICLLDFWSKLGSIYRRNRDGIKYPTIPYSTRKIANMWRAGAFHSPPIERISAEVLTDGREYVQENLISLEKTETSEIVAYLECTDIPGGVAFAQKVREMGYTRVNYSKTIRIVLLDEGHTTSKCIIFWECKRKHIFSAKYVLHCHMIIIY